MMGQNRFDSYKAQLFPQGFDLRTLIGGIVLILTANRRV